MKRLILIYNLLILIVFVVASMLNARSASQFLFTLLFIPPLIYFYRLLTGQFHKHYPTMKTEAANDSSANRLAVFSSQAGTISSLDENDAIEPEFMTDPEVSDVNRRLFLKLIGSAGVSAFLFSIFTDKAQASFFGSMPVPGAMTVKNTSGQAIDPAEKQPTDGYEISEIDDSTSPAYYGFVHKTGAWYISQEGSTGSYRYVKGGSDFPSAWTNRATLTYDYFDNVF